MTTPHDNKPRNFALSQFARRKRGEVIPSDIQFDVTYRCNLKCVHCYVESAVNAPHSDELSTLEIKGILGQLFEAGVLSVTFSGGEPLCRPDIFEIMEFARDRGLFFGLKTNGTLITEKVADRLSKLGVVGVHVSLYAAIPPIHACITGVPGSFSETIQSIKLLHERNIRVGIKTSLMKYNADEVQALELLAEQLGVDFRPDPIIFPKMEEIGCVEDIRMDDHQLKKVALHRNWVPSDEQLTHEDLEEHLICNAARTRCAISPEGEVYPCGIWRIPMGDLRHQTFKNIWHGAVAEKIRSIKLRHMGVCAWCDLAKYCARCMALAYMENGSISGPSSENCRLARVLKGVKENARKETLC